MGIFQPGLIPKYLFKKKKSSFVERTDEMPLPVMVASLLAHVEAGPSQVSVTVRGIEASPSINYARRLMMNVVVMSRYLRILLRLHMLKAG